MPDLEALRAGDEDAWESLLESLHPVSLAVAKHRLGNIVPQDVEDIAIQAVEGLMPTIAEVKDVEELRPLVAAIAYRRSIDRLRKHYRSPREEKQTPSHQDDDDHPTDDSGSSPEETLRIKDLAGMVQHIIKSLKPRVRAILIDAFYHERSHKEIAERHQLAIGSIGMTLKRAYDDFRAELLRQPRIEQELRGLLGMGQQIVSLLLCFI